MYSISKILRRTRRFDLSATSFGSVNQLEISLSDKESVLKSPGLIYNNKSQGSIRFYSARDAFSRFLGINNLSSIADAKDKGGEEEEEDKELSEEAESVEEDDSVFDSELGSSLEIEKDHPSGKKTRQKKRVHCKLLESILAHKSVKHGLESWVKEGKEFTQAEVSLAIHNLRNRKSYPKCLQIWDWLRANTKFEFTEANYASHLDLIAKVNGLQKAEDFLTNIPESHRGEIVYRTLLANSVFKLNVKKSEELFEKMRGLNFPISVFACNQLLLLYSKHDKSKIADVLLLMEKENVKPTRGTYMFLLTSKGLAGDVKGMESVGEMMKEEGIELDPEIQATIAKFYIRGGFKERAREVMKEIESKGLKETPWVCRSLLPLYAEIGDRDNVKRLCVFVEETLRYDNCLSAMKAWGKLKEIKEAEEVFEKLVKKYKLVPMLPYFALMEIYTDNKMLEKGKELVTRVANAGIKIGPSSWHALVKLYISSGEVGRAVSILEKAGKEDNKTMRPMFTTYMAVLEEYARRGDVRNAENVFLRMKNAGYAAQLTQYDSVLSAYLNSKTPAYGMSERMRADNVFPNKGLAAKLASVDPFKKTPMSVLLDEV